MQSASSATPDDLETFLKQHCRPALVAKECASSSAASILSRQGPPLAAKNEDWPQKDGEALVPVLSVYVPELPFVPHFLAAAAYWTFFIQREPWEHLVRDGTLVVRKYESVTGLKPLKPPARIEPRPCPLQFHEVRDYLCETAFYEILADRPLLLREYEAREREFREQFPCHDGIKLGGWPLLIQETAFLKQLNPPFQIQLDMSEYFHKGDSGIGYICCDLTYACWETI